MKLPWFKMPSEARNDRMLDTLSDAEFRTWFKLHCFASEQPVRGTISDYDDFQLAIEVAGGDEDLLGATVKKLERLGKVSQEGGNITFLGFLDQQYQKPSDQPQNVRERVARHRSKSALGEVTPSNAPATPGNAKKRVEQKRQEENRNEEQEPCSATAQLGQGVPVPTVKPPLVEERLTRFAEEVWELYPPRNGKKLNKPKFLAVLRRVPESDWNAVLVGVRNFRISRQATDQYAPDAFRWIRDAGWRDWQEPETVRPSNGAHRQQRPTRRERAISEGFQDAFGVPLEQAFDGADERAAAHHQASPVSKQLGPGEAT